MPGESACGPCLDEQRCLDNRCYTSLGPAGSLPPAPELMRGLSLSPEGERCVVKNGGVIERVEAALWEDGAASVVLELYVSCGEKMVQAASAKLPGSALPHYDGIHGEMRMTTFVLSQPIGVREGDTVIALFHAEYGQAVSGLYLEDVDPSCEYNPNDLTPGLKGQESWDYMARFNIH